MDTRVSPLTRPLLRGYLHLVVALVSPFALLQLLFISDSPRDYVGSAIFGASLILIYTTSAIYHVVPWSASYRAILRRADHSMIFIFIGGTYTPFMLKLLSNQWGIPIMSAMWMLAGLGIILKIIAPGAPRWLGVSIYLSFGWIGIIPVFQVATSLPTEAFILVMTGGVLYSVGAFMYLKRWPNPFPRIFGFHEVFHSLVVLASGVYYFVVATYVLQV